MEYEWALQDAKSKFSELFSLVCEDGPRRVTRRGKDAIILISEPEYDRLVKKKPSFVDFLRSAPKVDLEIERDSDYGRELDL